MKLNSISALKTKRDVQLFKLDERILVVACDSAGAIGSKPLDKVKVDPITVGRFTARVALMEVLATGAHPICLSCTLSVEPKPTGAEIAKGIRNELKRSGFSKASMIQSTEKNFLVRQTGVGVTVLGLARSRALMIGRCKRDDVLVAVGVPYVGREVVEGEKKRRIADAGDIMILLSLPFVHELIAVGSKGINHEAKTLASDSNLRFRPLRNSEVDLKKSGGPATVVLCALSHSDASKLSDFIDKPLNLVGVLH